MQLFLRCDLVKSASPVRASAAKVKQPKDVAARASTGEQRGGKYVARVQIGYDKDGSPKYRYFKSQEEYKNWKENKGKGKKKKRDNPHNLRQKVDREHRESTEKQNSAPKTAGSDPLKDNKTLGKSLYLRC